MSDDDEVTLIREFRRGSNAAARHIVARYGLVMFRVARGITGDADLAQDVVQETLVRVMAGEARFRGGSLSAWLRAASLRTALNARRAGQRAVARGDEYGRTRPCGNVSDTDPLLRTTLRTEIEGLPEAERTVFLLIEIEGWTHAEVGEALDVSVETSRQRLFRAREKLRAALHNLRSEI